MTIRRDVHDLLNRLAAAEEQFRANEFLAPALPGGIVHVRVASVLRRLRVSGFVGWGVFRPAGTDRARLVRRATPEERRRYLDALPSRRLILREPHDLGWLAWPAARFPGAELVPVHLVENGRQFDNIDARFDGVQCWFAATPNRDDPAAVYLRESFERGTATNRLYHAGLTPEQIDTYTWAEEMWRRRNCAPTTPAEAPSVVGVCLGGTEMPGFAGVMGDIPNGSVPVASDSALSETEL